MGDFNIERNDPSLKAFLNISNLYKLMKSNTCFKGKGSHIGFFLTNRTKFSDSYKTAVSDHRHMIYTMLISCFRTKLIKL